MVTTTRAARLLMALTMASLIWAPASASAIGTISDGGVTFGYSNNFNTSFGNTVDTVFTGAGPGNQTFESWWFFRVSGDGRESAFSAPDQESYTGSTGRLEWDDANGNGDFRAILDLEVIEQGPGDGNLFQNMRVINTSGGDLTIDIFHYTDFDLSGTFAGDSAVLTNAVGDIELLITDESSSSPFIGYGADHYEVTAWRTLLRDLTDNGIDDLGDSGAPFGPDDFTGGFQWTFTVADGETETLLTQFATNAALLDPSAMSVPEPGTAVLLGLGLAMLAGARRRAD